MSLRRATTPDSSDPIARVRAQRARETGMETLSGDPAELDRVLATVPRTPTCWTAADQVTVTGGAAAGRSARAFQALRADTDRQSGGSASTKPMGASKGTARGWDWRHSA